MTSDQIQNETQNPNPKRKFGIWVFFLLWNFGCSHFPSYQSSPINFIKSPEEILDHIERRNASLVSLRSLAKLSISYPEGKISGKEIIVAKVPSFLHIQVLDPFGSTVFSMATDGKTLSFYNSSQRKFYQGKASKENFSLFSPFPLEDLIQFTIGRIPLIPYSQKRFVYQQKKKIYILNLMTENPPRIQNLWIEPTQLRVIRNQIISLDEGTNLDVDLSDFQEIQGYLFAKKIKLEIPERSMKIIIHHQEPELNPSVGFDAFSFSIPKGVEIMDINELGSELRMIYPVK